MIKNKDEEIKRLKSIIKKERKSEEKDIDELVDTQVNMQQRINDLFSIEYKFSNIYKVIKIARLIKGYTQNDLCLRLNINRSSYSRYESGNRQIPFEILDNIFDELDIKTKIESKK